METNTNAVQAKIDENRWVVQIKESISVLQEEDDEYLCASVFNVPNELLALNPKAFIPQSVSIGPYHHWRSELFDMERYKVAIARRFEKRINGLGNNFEAVVVEEFRKHDWQIRSCYDKFIDYKDETLAWLMSLDAVFLLQCLQFYVRNADRSSDADVRPLGRVLDPSGASAAYNSILRDLMMLENQLPLFLLQKLLELQLDSKDMADERIENLLRLVCQELSPFAFKLPEDSKLNRNGRGHVLEVLYYTIVPSVSNNQNPNASDKEENESPDTVDMSISTQTFTSLWTALSSLNCRPIRVLKELQRRLLNLPVLTEFKRLLSLRVKSEKEEGAGEGKESSVKIIPPTRDELAIPSVADLYSAGVKFVATNGDLTTIQFDMKTATLYLPRVELDTNTEVILRNLVAFEASVAPGALVFTRYTNFMNGMIDSEEDVRSLRENGIISNHLQNDEEVASLWNSMGRCVRLTNVEFLDKVIEDVNTYYNRKWKVAVVKFLKEHIYRSWKILSLVAAVILLVVTCLQAFCSVYDCRKWFNQ